MNNIIIKGRLTADPELKTTQSNISICTVNVAVDRSYSKDENTQTDFFTCVFWRGTAEFIAKYFSKGQEILIHGEMQSRKYTDKDGNNRTAWNLQARSAEFCGSKAQNSRDSQQAYQPTYAAPTQGYSQGSMDDFADITSDDDLPF